MYLISEIYAMHEDEMKYKIDCSLMIHNCSFSLMFECTVVLTRIIWNSNHFFLEI